MNQNPTALNGAKESTNGAKVTVTLLGTGDAFASFGRSQAGYLIDAPVGRVLMEAGPGLMQALKGGGVSTDSFDLLLISHLHGDHFGGLPFLILDYMWETRRKKALTIARRADLVVDAHDVPAFRARQNQAQAEVRGARAGPLDAAGQVQGQCDSQSAHQAGYFAVTQGRRRRQVDSFLGRQRME
jgi:ribonuclease BN (tRNA processing enzyme)